MSDNENAVGTTSEVKSGMPQADVDFLITCLKNTTSGSIAIDAKAVAEALGYANHRSVSNRVTLLKKKYDLPFGSSAGTKGSDEKSPVKGKKASDPNGFNDQANEKTTPKPNTKKRATAVKKTPTPRKKKTPTPKKKVKKEDSGDEGDVDGEDEYMVEAPEVQAPKTPSPEPDTEAMEDERVFGKLEPVCSDEGGESS